MRKYQEIIRLTRPFTLVYPAIAVLSGALLAINLAESFSSEFNVLLLIHLILGIIIAPLLNASSNIINQIYDLEIDRINKPSRPLPQGSVSLGEAKRIAFILAFISVLLSWFVSFYYFLMVMAALIATLIYSVPPIRSKRFHWYANLTMAIPRGLLLIVAGWATIASITEITPWLFGIILFLYILGANTAKDFSDMEGDKKNDVISLPIKYEKRVIHIIKPFFIYPFLLVLFFCAFGLLDWIFSVLIIFSFFGYKTIKLIENEPDLKNIDDNHPSWKLMYQTVALYTLFIGILGFIAS